MGILQHDGRGEPDVSNKGAGMRDPGGGVGYEEDGDIGDRPDAETMVRQMITDNPDMNLNTFLNMLQKKGLHIKRNEDVDNQEQTGNNGSSSEADTSSALGQFLRDKESAHCELKVKSSAGTFKEAGGARDDGIGYTRFYCILIQEGLGNFGDAFFYTKEAIKSAVPIFEGAKIYADHPDKIEEETRPERSVRDILGNFENIRYTETKGGLAQLVGELVVLGDKQFEWARGLLRHCVEFSKKYPDKDFVGLSINAGGDAYQVDINEFAKSYDLPEEARSKLNEAIEKGIEKVQVVTKIDEAKSCDLVTEAGAGGRITNFIENAGGVSMKKTKKYKEAKDELKKEAGSGVEPSDEEVIKKMMSDELTEMGFEPDDKNMEMAHEAYQACKEMGDDDERAMKGMKMAMNYGKKMNEMANDDDAEKKKIEADDAEKKENDDKEMEEANKSKSLGDRIQLLEKKTVTLAAENSALREGQTNRDVKDYLDKKLSQSKLPRKVTKQFTEYAGELKSKKQIDEKLNLFVKVHESAIKETNATWELDGQGYDPDSGEADSGSFDLSDCAK